MSYSPRSGSAAPPPEAAGRPHATDVFAQWALEALRRNTGSVPIRIKLADGAEVAPAHGPAVATVTIKRRSTLLQLLRNPDVAFGEAFISGDVEVEGDLVAFLEAVFRAQDAAGGLRSHRPPTSHSLEESRSQIEHHYDVGNDFYRLWLDDQLVYTCAYFPVPSATLEAAQVAKMDLVCRKLRLRPGEHVVEAGCGWGALATHMAQRYGVSVTAYNISREQLAYARERAAREGLGDRVAFVEGDYRAIHGSADAFVSVGMLEHVGPADYPMLGKAIRRVLGEGRGRGLLHFIGRSRPHPLNPWIVKRIFPGAYPPTLVEAIGGVLEPENLSVIDVENLRLHYATTLDHWRRRYMAAADEVRRMFDAPFERAWRLYLSGSQAAFMAGSLQLFQVVFAPANKNSIPWTRGTAYEGDAPGRFSGGWADGADPV
jgi:cyclopropane-fatty-acyl-phospholipid synthase